MNQLEATRIKELEAVVQGLINMIETEHLEELSPTWRYAVALASQSLCDQGIVSTQNHPRRTRPQRLNPCVIRASFLP